MKGILFILFILFILSDRRADGGRGLRGRARMLLMLGEKLRNAKDAETSLSPSSRAQRGILRAPRGARSATRTQDPSLRSG